MEKNQVLETLTLFLIKKHFQMGEFILGLFSISWGLWLVSPIFAPFDLSRLFNIQAITSNDLGMIMIAIGLVTVLAAGSPLYKIRQLILFVNMFAWGFITLLFLIASPSNPTVATYAMLGVYSFWQYVKLVVFIGIQREFLDGVPLAPR